MRAAPREQRDNVFDTTKRRFAAARIESHYRHHEKEVFLLGTLLFLPFTC